MMEKSRWLMIATMLEQMRGPLTEDEVEQFGVVSLAITHALERAHELPATFDSHARGLLIDKLHEAEHWLIESLRRTLERT